MLMWLALEVKKNAVNLVGGGSNCMLVYTALTPGNEASTLIKY